MGRLAHLAALLLLTAGLLAAGLTGCGGGLHGAQLHPALDTPAASGPVSGFDAPADMLSRLGPDRSSSAMVIYRKGSDFGNINQRVAAQGNDGHFTPAWAGNWCGFDTLAFGLYRYNVVGFSGAQSVTLNWTSPPAAGDAWVALSQWTKDRWVWFACPADNVVHVGGTGLLQYAKQGTGEVLVVVLLLGSDACDLHEVYLGETLPVHTVTGYIKTAAGTGVPGVTLSFSGGLASVSTDASGYWERDGVYEGSYTVTPSKSGVTFVPMNRNFSIAGADVSGANFAGSSAQGEWWMFGREPRHRRCSANNGPANSTVRWQYVAGNAVRSSPALANDGTIYVGCADSKLYAMNPGGTLRWSYTTGGEVWSSPAVGPDGTVYVGSLDDKLYAVRPDGTLGWSFTTGGDIFSSPVIAPDNTIYVGSYDDKLYAVNPDGTLKWSFTTGGDVASSPAVDGDGTVYVGSFDGKLYAVNPDGTAKWEYATGDAITLSSPTVADDGTVYIGSFDNKLYAINPDGTLKWSYATGDYITGSIALGGDGTVYFPGWDNALHALNPDGTPKWTFTTGGNVMSSPALGSDGTLYFGCDDGYFYAVDSLGALKWSYDTGSAVESSPAITADGGVVAGSDDGRLWAFGPGGMTYTVTGYVKDQLGAGLTDVTISLTGGLGSVITDGNGLWTKTGVPNGAYTATPSKAGYQFNPASAGFTVADSDATVPDFTANPNTASGYVKNSGGTGVNGVTMSFTGGLSAVTTNSSGFWQLDGIPNGTYTVTPSRNGYTFNPVSRNFTINNNDVSVPDFTGDGSGAITILSVTTDKTTHLNTGTETPANLNVTTDPSPADTYAWTGPGDFSNPAIANPTWTPNGSTPLGKATLTITVTNGAANDSATIDMYVTQQPIVTQWTGDDSVNRQVGSPPGSGIAPDFDLTSLQYLEPLIDGGNIYDPASGTFYQQIEGQVVLFDRWELW